MQIDRKEFMEKVLRLEQEAKERGSRMSQEDILGEFSGFDMTEEQIDEIYRYFEARQIEIDGREKTADEDPSDHKIHTKDSRRDRDMVELYMAEMESAFRIEEGQENELLARFFSGDDEAGNLLVEGYLPMAAEIAGTYRGKGLMHSDLIQECNLGLLIAVNQYREDFAGTFDAWPDEPGADFLTAEEAGGRRGFRDYLTEAICSHVEDCLSEYTRPMRSARKMARQINRLNDTATAYARDYGREATPQELADRMGISEEEVRRLMKASLDAVKMLET